MQTAHWREAESITRCVAQAGGLAVALLLAASFAADLGRGVVVAGGAPLVYTLVVVAAMIGYAVAWDPRRELPGAAVALVGVLLAFLVIEGPTRPWGTWAMLGVAAPAVAHLLAVAMHRLSVRAARHEDALL